MGNWKIVNGISALVSQTSFCGDTSSGVVKCRLFSQTMMIIRGIDWLI